MRMLTGCRRLCHLAAVAHQLPAVADPSCACSSSAFPPSSESDSLSN